MEFTGKNFFQTSICKQLEIMVTVKAIEAKPSHEFNYQESTREESNDITNIEL
jgi:hypothetical protein